MQIQIAKYFDKLFFPNLSKTLNTFSERCEFNISYPQIEISREKKLKYVKNVIFGM